MYFLFDFFTRIHLYCFFIRKAVYAYDYDVLGACYPFEGDKVSVHWFRGKVIIVSKENAQKGPQV
jgi:hypothetical protein